ncbi:MAG: hypothetical protein JXD22_13390 [Sedimentisphaerales bacterium]|nr:hypothetical protein [Sedimentisphaerales bacterium]
MAKKQEKQSEKLCDYSCEFAAFARHAYCSDNVTIFCKKLKKMVRKFSPCPCPDKNQLPKSK